MPGGEDRLRAELERLARPADPEGAFDQIASKKARRKLIHKIQVVGLTVAVVGGTAGGTFALAKVFSGSGRLAATANPHGNGLIAFTKTVERNTHDLNNREIFVVRSDGAGLQRLTVSPGFDDDPAFSPDGTRIAFSRESVTHGSGGVEIQRGIFLMNADGSDVHQVAGCSNPACKLLYASPTWSPDGSRIAFATDVVGVSIDVVNSDGTGLKELCRRCGHGSPISSLAWSPDGTAIVFTTQFEGPEGRTSYHPLYLLDLENGSVRSLARATCLPTCTGPIFDLEPAWSPDGARIAVTRRIGTHAALVVMNRDGSRASPLYDCETPTTLRQCDIWDVAWSPDGSTLAYIGASRVGNGPWESAVFAKPVTHGAGRMVPNTRGADFGLSWQAVPAGQPQVTPSVSETPTATPAPTPTPTVTPSVSPSPTRHSGQPPSLGFACGATSVSADFDGDGTVDTLLVYPSAEKLSKIPMPSPCPQSTGPVQGPFAIVIGWGSGGTESWPFEQCVQGCAAYWAQDLDGNGTAEVALIVDEGASTEFMDLYEVPNDHLGPIVFEVGPPGTSKYPGFDPLKLPFGGSVTHQDFVTCQTGPNGGPQLIATSAALAPDQTVWNLSETVFDFNGQAPPNDVPPRAAKAFTVASTRDYTEPFDPGGSPPTPAGDPCFQPTL
jgi:TolB protein